MDAGFFRAGAQGGVGVVAEVAVVEEGSVEEDVEGVECGTVVAVLE